MCPEKHPVFLLVLFPLPVSPPGAVLSGVEAGGEVPVAVLKKNYRAGGGRLLIEKNAGPCESGPMLSKR